MTSQTGAAVSVRSYDGRDAEAWDGVVARSGNGTMLHTRRFISYHSDRFRDRSMMVEDRRGRAVGVFPAAEDRSDPEIVVSHPGLTYGGLVHDGSVRGALMIGALQEIVARYQRLDYRRLRYKAVPAIYHSEPADDDLYALFRLGARLYRRDLSAAIDLSHRGRVSHSRPQRRRRAENAGVSAKESWSEIDGFWRILEQNLAQRHGAAPLHSLGEIKLLHDRFPDNILLVAAKISETLVGGMVLFASGPVMKSQYTATSDEGRATFAVDPISEEAIDLGIKRGSRFFDFGTATLSEGQILSESLYEFKISFGAGGVAYDHYELDLR